MFDLIVLLILGVSALVGFLRGALRETITVLAFVIAAVLAILLLRFTGPIFRAVIHIDWLASSLAILVIFLAAYIALRVAGGQLVDRIKKTKSLSALDRTVGVGFGLVRALVALGLFNIVFHIATPPERTPKWVTEANLYPLTEVSADALRALAPNGSAIARRVGPAIENAVSEGDKAGDREYDARDRNQDPEKSR